MNQKQLKELKNKARFLKEYRLLCEKYDWCITTSEWQGITSYTERLEEDKHCPKEDKYWNNLALDETELKAMKE